MFARRLNRPSAGKNSNVAFDSYGDSLGSSLDTRWYSSDSDNRDHAEKPHQYASTRG